MVNYSIQLPYDCLSLEKVILLLDVCVCVYVCMYVCMYIARACFMHETKISLPTTLFN
jgi:hypothetical protein